jgi:hypothetical protein
LKFLKQNISLTSLILFWAFHATLTPNRSQEKKSDGTFAVKKISDGDTFWIYNGTEVKEKKFA